MTTPLEGDLPDQLLSDPKIQAESPQREIIATLENLTEKWQAYVPRNDAEEVALGVLLNSKAVQVVQMGAERKPNARLTITGLRWKALLENASESERPKVVYMILKLAFESQPEPEPAIEVIEPPELIGLREWLSIDGIKGHWQHTIAAAEFWHLEVDALHKDIAFLLRQVFGGDPSEEAIRDHLFKVHGLLPSESIDLKQLESKLKQDADRIREVAFGDNDLNAKRCVRCSKQLDEYDCRYGYSECHDCRSLQGKLADLYVAIYASGDSPDRIPEWPTIRAFLRDKFGPDRTNEQLWEWMTDHLRVLGWDQERWLRMKYGEFIELLTSGLLNKRPTPRNTRPTPSKDDAGNSELDADTSEWPQSKSLEECEPAERKAYFSFKVAEAIAERRLEDREAYDLLVDRDQSEFFTGELVDYKPPSFATWARQLRTARKATNERKYSSRMQR